jgi:hypothetical protein
VANGIRSTRVDVPTVLGQNGATGLDLVTAALRAVSADFAVADMSCVKRDPDIWSVIAGLDGTAHAGHCRREALVALEALDRSSKRRPLGLVIANLDSIGPLPDETYLVANIRNDIDGLRSLRVFFTVADPEFVVRNIADGHGSFNGRMTVYDWSGF